MPDSQSQSAQESRPASSPQPSRTTPHREEPPAETAVPLQETSITKPGQKTAIKLDAPSANAGSAGEHNIDIEWFPAQLGDIDTGRFEIKTQPGNTLEATLVQGAYRRTFTGQGSVSTTVIPSAPLQTKGQLDVRDAVTGETVALAWTWSLRGTASLTKPFMAGVMQELKKTPARVSTPVQPSMRAQAAVTSFFNISASGRRFAFIMDISGSMSGTRIERCRAELAAALKQLPESTEFIVLLFSDAVVEPPMQKDWIPARPDNVQQIIDWFNGVSANGGTDAWPAFKRAFKFSPKPDSIYFLTDGDLSGIQAEALSRLSAGSGSAFQRFMSALFASPAEHPEGATVINTIAVDESPSERLLQQIAADSGGEYRLVSSSDRNARK